MKQLAIKGVIVASGDAWIYKWLGMDCTCPADVTKALTEANGEDIEVLINSDGGSVFAGTEIYTKLREYAGKCVIKIQSMAASAAAVIAKARESEISPVAQIMIHNVSASAQGDNRDMEHTAEILKTCNQSLAKAFTAKTGKTEAEVLDMMDHETWMTAERAVKEGFVDRIMFEDKQSSMPMQLSNSLGSGLLPEAALEYFRTHLQNQKKTTARERAQAEYELLVMEERKHEV